MTGQQNSVDPNSLWDQLLSRQVVQVQAAFANLTPEEQTAVLAHLKRMAQETGWHAEQRLSALAALEALARNPPAHSS